MDIMTRDALRTAVIEKLLADFPKAQKVAGGVAFISETLDEETGLYFPVEIKVAVKNTQNDADCAQQHDHGNENRRSEDLTCHVYSPGGSLRCGRFR